MNSQYTISSVFSSSCLPYLRGNKNYILVLHGGVSHFKCNENFSKNSCHGDTERTEKYKLNPKHDHLGVFTKDKNNARILFSVLSLTM
jgi:hypothetical protein